MTLRDIALGKLPPPEYSGNLVILGGSEEVWKDLEGVEWDDFDVMAVNDVGMFYPFHLEHWYSNHANQLHGWNKVRGFHYRECKNLHSVMPPKYHAEGVRKWPFSSSGSSGLVACFVGLALGYEKVRLCGIGWDNTPYFFGPSGHLPNFINEVNETVARNTVKILKGRVESMSGRSRDLLCS